MKTIKLIDLLNKIANGEEVPKKIRVLSNNETFIYERELDDYIGENNDGLFNECIINTICLETFLNDTVEIIEEEKKIPDKWNDLSFTTMRKREDSIDDDIHKLKGYIETIMRTQNEFIDYLKSKGDE